MNLFSKFIKFRNCFSVLPILVLLSTDYNTAYESILCRHSRSEMCLFTFTVIIRKVVKLLYTLAYRTGFGFMDISIFIYKSLVEAHIWMPSDIMLPVLEIKKLFVEFFKRRYNPYLRVPFVLWGPKF